MLPGSSIPKTFTTRQSSENDKTPSWSLSKRRNTSLRSVTCSSDNWSWSWNSKQVCHLLFFLKVFKITKSTLIISSILSGFPFLPLIFLIDLEEFLTWKYLADIYKVKYYWGEYSFLDNFFYNFERINYYSLSIKQITTLTNLH